MTHSPSNRSARRRSLAGAAALLTAALPTAARAEGVRAGTIIDNVATATFGPGGQTVTITSNTVSVKVDEIVDVVVAPLATSPIPYAGIERPVMFTVTNTGNGPEAFRLTGVGAIGGDDFDPTIVRIVIDSNGNGTYDPATDGIVAIGGATPILDPDASVGVFVIAAAPGTASDAQRGDLRLEARATTGTGAAGTVFAGQGVDGGDAMLGASGGDSEALSSLVVARVGVVLSKSAVIADPFGGARPVPGALITYSLVATTSGTGIAPGLRIDDAIPAGTDYQPGTLKLEGATLTDGADLDPGTASPSGVAVVVGDQPAGTTRTVQFTVKIK